MAAFGGVAAAAAAVAGGAAARARGRAAAGRPKARAAAAKVGAKGPPGGKVVAKPTAKVAPRPAPKTAPGGTPKGVKLPPEPVKRPPIPPMKDPNFRAARGRVVSAGGASREHAPAASKVTEAQGAAKPPSNDVHSQAAAAQVGDMGAAPTPPFDKQAFMKAVREAVAAHAPQNLKQAMDFDESGSAGAVKGEVQGLVGASKNKSEAPIKATTKAEPDPRRGTAKTVTAMPAENPGPPPPNVAANAGMPQPQPPGATNFSRGPAEVNQEMAQADVTEDQLRESNEPTFNEAVDAKKEAEKHSATEPKKYRAAEARIVGSTRASAAAAGTSVVTAMHGKRVGVTSAVGSGKDTAKSKEEAKRAEIANAIDGIYTAAKTDVTTILDALDPKVESAFDEGEKGARSRFERYVGDQMRAYKKERYSGWRGKLRWAKDKLFDMPDEVNKFYEDGKKTYLEDMDNLVGRVADIVGQDLTAAHNRIAKGLTEVQDYVARQPKELQEIAKEAGDNITERFEELTQDVMAKQDALVKTIADKYVAGQEAVDARITELQEENKGLVTKVKEKIKGVIAAIGKLKDLLFNVLSRVAQAIGSIIRHPIRFLENLVSTIGEGISRFRDNIGKHLAEALEGWLFGNLAEAGIQAPESWDLKGILGVVLQLLGISYANIRARVVARVGEPATKKAEQTIEVFQTLVSEGPAGLWKFITGKLGEIKDKVWDTLQTWLEEKVVIAGITWLLSLLSPVSAFIKACKAIYDIIMFFIERGQQIVVLINTVLDAIEAIIAGNVSAVAEKIEKVLAQGLSLAISFLAALLGLGGVGKKVREVFEAIQKPVSKAIDGVVNLAVKGIKKVGGLVKRPVDWARGKIKAGKEYATAKVEAAKTYVRGKAAAGASYVKGKVVSVAERLGLIDKSFSMYGASHRLYVVAGARPRLMMASNGAAPPLAQLEAELRQAQAAPKPEADRVQALFAMIGEAQTVDALILAVAKNLEPQIRLDHAVAQLAASYAIYGDKHKRQAFGQKAPEVTTPVIGLYDDVSTAPTHANWTFRDTFFNNGLMIKTDVDDPQNHHGYVTRTFDPAKRTLVLNAAFLRRCARWVPGATPLNASGIPTVTYVQIRQMRIWEEQLATNPALRNVAAQYRGGLQRNLTHVKWSGIVNAVTIIKMYGLMREGKTAEQAFMQTHSYDYALTALTQSGHQYVPPSLKVDANRLELPLGSIMSKPGSAKRKAEDEELQKWQVKFPDFDLGTDVPQHFDVHSDVTAIP
jgi:hypothetical protein